MVRWLSLLLLIPLVILTISDIRSRTVSSWWLLTFGILNLIFMGITEGWKCVAIRTFGNLLLLLIVGLTLLAYAKVRHKRLPEMLGLGDVLFLVVVSPAFGWAEYLKYIVASSLVGILLWPLFRLVQPLKTGVPLVSVLALGYIVALGYKLIMV